MTSEKKQHLMYIAEPRAVLVEQRWTVLRFEQREHVYGWLTERFVFVSDAGSTRGQKSMYPLLPVGVEPVTIDAMMFDEAWEGAV